VRLIVSKEAAADLVRLREFLVDRNPGAAQRAAAAISNAIRSLGMYPERGRQAGVTNARELVVPFGRSAYVIRYALLTETDEVVVLRVWHGREQRA
jgi:plasmid stabilization system protein ParE